MDIILHPLLSLFKLPLVIFAVLRNLYNDYSTLLARAKAPPGFPVHDPTSAFWQDNPPYPELVDIQSPAGLPETADIVIIGSGITAVAIARTVLRELDRKGGLADDDDRRSRQLHKIESGEAERPDWVRVLVLEARQLCSGATGRNGGHIKASPYELFHRLVHTVGIKPERAAKLCAFQISHVQALKEVVQAEGIEEVSEFREVQTVDFTVDEATNQKIQGQANDFVPYRPPGYEIVSHSAEETQKLFGVNERVVGSIEYPAGALWPYRFVTALWKKLLDQFPHSLSIETSTAVQSVGVGNNPLTPYVVSTGRGEVLARHVVHATNGFAAQFIPSLQGKALGVLAHMTAQRPGQNFPKCDGKRSYSVIFNQGFDYITQRPGVSDTEGDELMIGGGLFQSGKQGLDMFGVYDDSKIDALTLMHLEGVMPTIFDWGLEAPGRRMIKAWSGIVAFTGDVMPLVGRLDPRITKRAAKTGKTAGKNGKLVNKAGTGTVEPGEWIAAYFAGDGMVWSWLCGTAVGIMLTGSEDEDLPKEPGRPGGKLASWFPSELYASWGRVQKLDIADLADEV